MATPRLEELRFLHEDIERLEHAISERYAENPKNIRQRLIQEHEIARFLDRIQEQSSRLLTLESDPDGALAREKQALGTGDPFAEFYRLYTENRDFHRRNPNEPVENLERAYRKRTYPTVNQEGELVADSDVDQLFSGEESFGRTLDLVANHEHYLDLHATKGGRGRRLTYLQYLDQLDKFAVKREDKRLDDYWQYVRDLSEYLQDFMKRTRPLEDYEGLFSRWDEEFAKKWEQKQLAGWEPREDESKTAGPGAMEADDPLFCADCNKNFNNENVFKNHLTGKKHKKAAEAKDAANGANVEANGHTGKSDMRRLKERAIAEREFRVQKLLAAMQTERDDTKVNVERRMGMTDKERQQEREAIMAEMAGDAEGEDEGSDDEGEERIYNPLKLPLGWDGKPIPYWLYRLHGLGVEYNCEICGNYIYMGRRNFEKHFTEARHTFGLRALGISKNLALFREIASIQEAVKFSEKMRNDEKRSQQGQQNVEQMEDSQGNVMPKKVYFDLQKQGLI